MRSTAPSILPDEAVTSGASTARTRRAPTRATRRARTQVSGGAPATAGEALVLDRYRLISTLGSGAFATVWLAVDERLAREVALKVISRGRVSKARFEREAWAAARLSHPGIVTLYEAASDHEAAYLVCELVRGCTLERALADGRLSDRALVAIGIALCDALAYAHGERIIHRDVKPSNVLIPDAPADAALPAKLTDFGVAHAIGGDSLTATGDVVGTAAYMAPEQSAGREARPETDLYALALVLYEGLTGINPLATMPNGQRSTRLGMYLPPLRRQRRDLPRELGLGIDLALRPRPAERGTVQELRAALATSTQAVSEKAGVVGAPWRPPTRSWRREDRDEEITPTSRSPTRRWRPHEDEKRPEEARPEQTTQRPPLALPARAGGAAAGAALAGWLAANVLSASPLAPAAIALAAAAVILALPRVGFLSVAFGLSVLAAIQGHTGEALLVAVGTVVPILAAPGGRPPWPLPVGAPLLGAVGLAGAWPAVAARAATVRGRAALGFTGWIWLALASALSSASLYVRVPSGEHSLWSSSPLAVTHHVLDGLITSGALAPAPVWALAAAALPLFVRRTSLARDAVAVAAWVGLLVLFTELAISVGHLESPVAPLTTVLVGALAAGAVAIAPSALAARDKIHGGNTRARFP